MLERYLHFHYRLNIIQIWILIRLFTPKSNVTFFAGTDITGPPEYTVTSPRPSVVAGNVAGEMKHRVQAAADYKAADSKEADHTVLLKLKEGDEYKLVLNMQVINNNNYSLLQHENIFYHRIYISVVVIIFQYHSELFS